MTEPSEPASDPSRTSLPPPSPGLSHLDTAGQARMVDISAKPESHRVAEARATIELTPEVCAMVLTGRLPKGEALAVARVAGILAAKDTSRLIPLCHPLSLDQIDVLFARVGDAAIEIRATARCRGSTGVEMEAMTAAAVAALTLYDMCKGVCRAARITRVELLAKSGGKSGPWRREATS